MGAGGQRLRLRRRARHAPVVRRHAASVGVHARLAPRAVAAPTRTRSTPASRTRRSSAPPTAASRGHELSGLREHGTGPQWQPGAGGMCLHTIILDPSDADRIYVAISAAGAFRTDDGGETWQPINQGLRSGEHPGPGRRGRALRAPHRHAPVPPRRALHAEALGRHAQRRRRRLLAGGQRQPAHRLRLPDRRPRARAGDHLRRADHERLAALPAGRQAARLPQPDRRQRVGGADHGPAAERLLRQRAARRDGGRLARLVRHLLRHHRRPGLRLSRRGRHLGSRSCATCRRCCRSKCRRCHETPSG